jgi:hypothetical protein
MSHSVLPRWQGGGATITVLALALVLAVLDITDRSVRHFWETHALTTDTVAGLLVLALTVLVVNQVVSRRQLTDRSRAVAVQAGIVLVQAMRSVKSVLAVRDGAGDQTSARDELRTYSVMLLVSAPVLIEDRISREFLEQAQALAGEIGRVLAPSEVTAVFGSGTGRGLEEAIERLRTASAPLLAILTTDERSAVTDPSAGTGDPPDPKPNPGTSH